MKSRMTKPRTFHTLIRPSTPYPFAVLASSDACGSLSIGQAGAEVGRVQVRVIVEPHQLARAATEVSPAVFGDEAGGGDLGPG